MERSRYLVSLDEERCPRLTAVFADGGYQGKRKDWAADEPGLKMKIVHKIAGQSTFVVPRSVGSRSDRQLHSDFGTLTQSSVPWLYAAMIRRMVRHLTSRANNVLVSASPPT